MPWQIVIRNNTFGLLLLVVAFSLQLAFTSHQAGAQDMGVSAVICGGDSTGAQLDLVEPSGDTVVNLPTITLRGTVSYATQIEISIDGSYVRTVALSSEQTTFETDIELSKGTHTIELKANDVCQQQDATDSVVITYEPVEEPTNGGSTPTEVDNGGSGIIVNPESNGSGDEIISSEQLGGLGMFGGIAAPIKNFLYLSGLEGTVQGENAFIGLARVVLTIIALTAIIAASAVTPFIIHAVPALAQPFGIGGTRGFGIATWLVRATGLIVLSLLFFL